MATTLQEAFSQKYPSVDIDKDVSQYKNFYYISTKNKKGYLPENHLLILLKISSSLTQSFLRDVIVPIIKKGSTPPKKKKQNSKRKQPSQPKVSLRCLDWLATNYSLSHAVSYNYMVNGEKLQPVTVHTVYKVFLKRYKRVCFDPFRRRECVFLFVCRSEI